MCAKAKKHGVAFRPHFKTHQSHTIGKWFREEGVSAITVSSLRMAQYFAADGWNDITVAFPVNILEIELIRDLSSRISLNLLALDPEPLAWLERELGRPVGIFLKIDAGYGRTGIPSTDMRAVDACLAEITRAKKLRFKGFIAHAGNTYRAGTRGEILAIHETTRQRMSELGNSFKQKYPDLVVSIGDTPGCSLAENFKGIDEMRPGNFVFYDAMQMQLGSCSLEQVAVVMACPVVAKHPERNTCIVYGGAIHFSKDFIMTRGVQNFGPVVRLTDGGWSAPVEGAFVSSLSQEHGVVSLPPEFLGTLKSGSLLGVIPVHSCLTADCMRGYRSLEGIHLDHMSGEDPGR
jgi:D-serine deaminase-like pyridoxal phosphate-dependent protein